MKTHLNLNTTSTLVKYSVKKTAFKTFLLFVTFVFIACNNTPVPKPSAFLKLEYPKANYNYIQDTLSYKFKISNLAQFNVKSNQWGKIEYPNLNAEVHITYQPVRKNLLQLVGDAEKLTYKHTIKADHIDVFPYEHLTNRVYARLFTLTGDVASPIQFQVTDSVQHFIYGSLYFKAKPNYDSIQPTIHYIKKDIEKLVESMEWQQ